MELNKKEFDKYMKMREINPLWNSFTIDAEAIKDKAEYIRLINKSNAKGKDECEWYNSQEVSDNSLTNNKSTTATKNGDSYDEGTDEENKLTFKERLEKIKKDEYFENTDDSLGSAKKVTKQSKCKKEDKNVEEERRKRNIEHREILKKNIQREAMAKLEGVTLEKFIQLEQGNSKEATEKESQPISGKTIKESQEVRLGDSGSISRKVENRKDEIVKPVIKESKNEKAEVRSVKEEKRKRSKSPSKINKKLKNIVEKVELTPEVKTKPFAVDVQKIEEAKVIPKKKTKSKKKVVKKSKKKIVKTKGKKKVSAKKKIIKPIKEKSKGNLKPKQKKKRDAKAKDKATEKRRESKGSRRSSRGSKKRTSSTNLSKILQDDEIVLKKRPARKAHLKALEKRKKLSETGSITKTSQSSRNTTENEELVKEKPKIDLKTLKKREIRRRKLIARRDKEIEAEEKKKNKPIIKIEEPATSKELDLPEVPERLRNKLVNPNTDEPQEDIPQNIQKKVKKPVKKGKLSKIEALQAVIGKQSTE